MNKIIKFFSLFAIVLLFAFSFLIPKNYNSLICASADDTQITELTFTGSSLGYYSGISQSSTHKSSNGMIPLSSISYINSTFTISYNNGAFSCVAPSSLYFTSTNQTLYSSSGYSGISVIGSYYFTAPYQSLNSIYIQNHTYNLLFIEYSSDGVSYNVDNLPVTPSLDMVRVVFGNYIDFSGFTDSNNASYFSTLMENYTFGTLSSYNYYNYVRYYDSVGISYTFILPLAISSSNYSYSNAPSYYYSSRSYYLNDLNSSNDEYQQGFLNGYNQGISASQEEIYNRGFSLGNSTGYQNGYYDGIAESNNYTFIGLLGAVVDVPVKTVMGLLNFEVLGINLFGFLTGLMTFALILFIIKLILGGK